MRLKDRFTGKGILSSLEDINSGAFNTKKIDINKILPNPANDIYSLENIDELTQNIIENGLIHNLVVKPLPDGSYVLISGHRRRLALIKAYELTGNDDFKNPECKIRDDLSDDVDAEIALHKASLDDRVLTGKEKSIRAKRLMELYKIKKERGEQVEGKIRRLVAQDMDISESQVQRLINMDKLIPEFKEIIDEGKLSISTAERFSKLTRDDQLKAYKEINHQKASGKEKITRSEAENIIKDITKPQNKDSAIFNPDFIKDTAERMNFLSQLAAFIAEQTESPYDKWETSIIKKYLTEISSIAKDLLYVFNNKFKN